MGDAKSTSTTNAGVEQVCCQLARIRKLDVKIVGQHGGAKKSDKLIANIERMKDLFHLLQKFKPDLTLSFCTPDAARMSFGLGIKHIAFSNSPHHEKVMKLTVPLVDKLLIPKHIPKKDFTRYGISPKDIILLNNKGIVFAGKSNHKEAIKCFDTALEVNPVDLDTLCNKGNSLAELEDFNSATTCFESALEIDSKDYDAWFRLGVAYANTNRPKEAIRCFNKVLKKDPSHTDALINKGIAYMTLKKYTNSVSSFDKALKIDKQNVDAMYHKSQSLAEIGKHKQAKSVLLKIAKNEKIHHHDHDKDHHHENNKKHMSIKEKILHDIHFTNTKNEKIYLSFIQNL